MFTRAAVLAGLSLALLLQTPAWGATVRTGKVPAALLKARLEAAENVYKGARLLLQIDPKSIDAERMYCWSHRWLDAQRALGSKKVDSVAACEAHLARMKDLQELTKKMVQGGVVRPLDVNTTKFYVAEAEVWLAEAKAE
jgi:hypothetical protein